VRQGLLGRVVIVEELGEQRGCDVVDPDQLPGPVDQHQGGSRAGRPVGRGDRVEQQSAAQPTGNHRADFGHERGLVLAEFAPWVVPVERADPPAQAVGDEGDTQLVADPARTQ
jgi:hypothetical protein